MSDSHRSEQAMYYDRAELYDRIYHFKDFGADADQLHAVLLGEGINDGARVLEAACGTGSFLGPLGRHYDVTGFDLSPDMLAIARTKLPDAQMFVADMRDFTVPEAFDVVICPFSSIGYMLTEEDLASTFTSFRRALRTGGVTVFEPFIQPKDWKDDGAHLMTYDGEDMKCCRANVSQREGDISILDFHWLVVRPGVGVEHFTEIHRLRLWRTEEMGKILGEAGFAWRFEETGRGRFIGRAI